MISSFSYYTAYKAGDVVKYSNRVFQALVDTQNRYPPTSDTNNEYWQFVPAMGKIFLINKGTYSASTTYSVLDVVTRNGKRYIAKQSTHNNAPSDNGDNDYWQLIAESGNYRATLGSDGILN